MHPHLGASRAETYGRSSDTTAAAAEVRQLPAPSALARRLGRRRLRCRIAPVVYARAHPLSDCLLTLGESRQ